MTTNPFDYVNSILKNKLNMIRGSEEGIEITSKPYNPYLTNKALSFYVDSVLYANEMNMLSHIDKDQQYEYLINNIRSMNRTHTWFKQEKNEDIELLMGYYYVNRQRAIEISKFISEEDLKKIKSQVKDGGNIIKK
jgi:nitrogen regulatory protein PII-like uncharacterized protein